MLKDKIKEAASLKVWARLGSAVEIANDPDAYWKMDEDKKIEMRERDIFDKQVWNYIVELVEKDNVL